MTIMTGNLFDRYPSGETPIHSHSFHELVLPFKGWSELQTEKRLHRIHIGQGVATVARERHACRATSRNQCTLIVDIATDGLAAQLEFQPVWDFAVESGVFPIDPGLHRLVQFAAQRIAEGRNSPEFEHYWKGLLLFTLADQITNQEKGYPARIQRALDYIHVNYAHRITVNDIGNAVGLSVSRLHALFHTCVNKTPQDYITTLRLDKAQELLADSTSGIAEIAVQTGFADQSALTKTLKKHRGITPGDYRRCHVDWTNLLSSQ